MKDVDLKLFCSKDETRAVLCGTHVCYGWEYATDGRVLVRMRTMEPDRIRADGLRYPMESIHSIFEKACKHEGVLVEVPIPELPPPDEVKCSECGGNGFYTSEFPCDECDGKGKWRSSVAVPMGDSAFSDMYLELLRGLPGLVFYVGLPLLNGEGFRSSAYFTFEGGEGVLQPMRVR